MKSFRGEVVAYRRREEEVSHQESIDPDWEEQEKEDNARRENELSSTSRLPASTSTLRQLPRE